MIGANPRQAERLFDLPPNTTSDFCYHVSPGGTTLADFYISESDFLAWLRSQKEFEPGSYSEIIESPHDIAQYELVSPVRRIDSAEHCLKVRRGYSWFMTYPNRGDHTKSIVYDLDSGRAYYQHNLR